MSEVIDTGNIFFDLPKNQSNAIKVIGVGGGGSNAVNYMFQQGIKGVDFVVCNTDAQALQNSPVPNKIQLGASLTEGLGAGANPEIGERAALESHTEIGAMLETHTKMVFITAGMGGGTGTGAAPVIARLAKDLDILTVGIVTMPFQFEGKTRSEQAQAGIKNMRQYVDSLVIINNNKLREVYGNLGFKAGFAKADEVLATAARGIAEVITHHYTQNIDLRDARTVLANSGTAIMGSAKASGSNRAQEAIIKALDSPLLNDNKIKGAKNVLLLIVSGATEITIDEIGEINDHIQNEAGNNANIIMGVGEDETLGDAIAVTIIATGFDAAQQHEIVHTEIKKIIHTLEEEQRAEQELPLSSMLPLQSFKVEESEEKVFAEDRLVEGEVVSKLSDIEVIYEEVGMEDEDFIIIDTTAALKEIPVDFEEIKAENDDQMAFVFDLPLSSVASQPADELTTRIPEEGEMKSYEALAEEVAKEPETQEKRYSLEEYMEIESHLMKATPQLEKTEVVDEELAFEKKIITETVQPIQDEGSVDPLTSSIEQALKQRAEERRKKLKEFNYKFHNLSKIDEMEKQPAYKRMGITLEEEKTDEKMSRLSLGTDSEDGLPLRTNNSFLHDNVD